MLLLYLYFLIFDLLDKRSDICHIKKYKSITKWYKFMFWKKALVVVSLIFSYSSLSSASTAPSSMESFYTQNWLEQGSAVDALILQPKTLEKIYTDNDFQLIWTHKNAVRSFELQLDFLKRANISQDFSIRLQKLIELRSQESWSQYDLLATDTFLAYLSYVEHSQQDGERWYFDEPAKGKVKVKVKLKSLYLPSESLLLGFEQAIKDNQIAEFVQSQAPPMDDYARFIQVYFYLLDALDHPRTPYQQTATRRPGDKMEVANRDALIELIEYIGVDITKVEPQLDWYDDSLVAAVKQFQKMHGLTMDGMIGGKTLYWINMLPEQRLHILALNAERMRLWPRERSNIIMVNIPAFEVKYWHQDQLIIDERVVVGRSSRKTPIMVTNLNTIIINPTWNVPHTIMVEDIIPMVKKDRSYLEKHQMAIIRNWSTPEIIDPETIDWSMIDPDSFPYRIRQNSGTLNALGQYKFNTPNSRAIYLHDTPSKSLFSRDSRAYSSGCIRVRNASSFARKILESQRMVNVDIEPANNRENHPVTLKQRIPVHIIYQTFWIDAGGINYRNDVYDYDNI